MPDQDPDDHCSTHNQLHPCHVCAIINGAGLDRVVDDRGARDNGFIFDVPEVFADTVDRWITRGRPASDGVLYPYDVFAHLDT